MKPEEIVPSLVPFLIVMIVVQAMMAGTFNAAGVLAPVAAPELGVSVAMLGPYSGVWGLASLAGGMLIDGVLRRYGAARTLQIAVIVTAAGMLCGATGNLFFVALSSIVVGFGSGMLMPCAIHLVARVTPPEKSGLVIAINQCGIPAGYGLAGVAIPLLLTVMHWRWSLVALAVALLLMVPLIQIMREGLDSDRDPAAPLAGKAFVEPALMAWNTPKLRLMGWLTFSCMTVQMTAITYMVSYVKIELGFSHLAAGTALFVSQLAAIFARLFFGWALDRSGRHLLVTGILATGSGLSAFTLGMATSTWSYAAVIAAAAFCGTFVMGWNGAYFATVSKFAPPGRQGKAVGGTQIFTMVGGTAGPIMFASVLGMTGHYGWGFILVSAFSFVMGLRLLWMDRREAAQGNG